MRSGIYAIVHRGSGRFYIGSATNVRRRRLAHLGALARGNHANRFLQRAWAKYGRDAFEFVDVADVPADALLSTESRLLARLTLDPRCYNVALDAGAPMRGRKHRTDARAKMSAARKGKPRPPEACAAMRAYWVGRHHTAETRAKLSAARKGKRTPPDALVKILAAQAKVAAACKGVPRTAEVRAKVSAALTGRRLSPEHRAAISAGLKRRAH